MGWGVVSVRLGGGGHVQWIPGTEHGDNVQNIVVSLPVVKEIGVGVRTTFLKSCRPCLLHTRGALHSHTYKQDVSETAFVFAL